MIRLIRVFVPAGTLTMLISELLWVTAAFVLATFVFLPSDPVLFLLYDNGMVRIVLVVLSVMVTLHFHDLYTEWFVKSRLLLLQQLCMVAGIVFVVQGLISYLNPGLRVPLRVMVPGSMLAMAIVFVWRIVFSAYVLQVVGRERVLFVGATPMLGEVARQIESHPEKGSRVVGYLTDDSPRGAALAGGTVLGGFADLREVVENTQPNRIVMDAMERVDALPVPELLEMRFAGQVVEEAAGAYERIAGRVCLRALRPEQVISSGEYEPASQDVFYQTAMNRLLALVGMLVSLPAMLAAAVAVKLSSPGPVLNRLIRVGRDGRRFTLYKFRTTRGANCEADLWIPREDPRVSRVGRWLRLTRADELPQLYNVLRGDMSIVGPRAERPEFARRLTELIPCYSQRHAVRPGIVGWAQINKEEDAAQDALARLEYDLYYIKNMSATMDTFILLHTLKAVVLSRGAD